MEGAASVTWPLPSLARSGQMQAGSGDGRGPRTARVHLGDRSEGGSRQASRAVNSRVATSTAVQTGTAASVVVEGHTERRILEVFYAAGLRAGSAPLVRGSSRRITIMRCRPANIRVINRRDSRFGHFRCCIFPEPGVPTRSTEGRAHSNNRLT